MINGAIDLQLAIRNEHISLQIQLNTKYQIQYLYVFCDTGDSN